MCVDLSHLNKYVLRERYQSRTPAQAVADIAATDVQVFTVLYVLKGYHQCRLDQQSQLLTTFITPFGCFKYLRAPYGMTAISLNTSLMSANSYKGVLKSTLPLTWTNASLFNPQSLLLAYTYQLETHNR